MFARVVLVLVPVLLLAAPLAAQTQVYSYASTFAVATPLTTVTHAACGLTQGEPCLGGIHFGVTGRNVVAGPTDDIWGTDAAALLCVYHPDGAENCRGVDVHTGVGCGARVLQDIPFAAERGSVFLFTLYVDDGLKICGATKGTVAVSTT